MDKNKQGADRQQGREKPQHGRPPHDPRRPGLDRPGTQREQGDRTHPSFRPDPPDEGGEGGMDRRLEWEGRERSDRDAGAGRPVQLDDEEGEGTAPRA